MKRICMVLGTARHERESAKVASYLRACFDDRGAPYTFVDVASFVHEPRTVREKDEPGAMHAWQDIVIHHDVFVFVLPEYNHGYPGEWKLLMDSLFDEYKGKDCYIVGVSNGVFAGARMAVAVLPVLSKLGFSVHRNGLFVGSVPTLFDGSGIPTNDEFETRARVFIDEVINTA